MVKVMSENIFEEFDKAIDTEGLQKDIKESEENGSNYREVPKGDYEVSINKLEIKASKNGDPMFSCWFKVLTGDYENCLIFMNQVITQGFQIHIVNEFLRSLDTGKEVEFTTYSKYAELLEEIKKEIDNQKLEYGLEYGERKGFSTFKITDVFDSELPF